MYRGSSFIPHLTIAFKTLFLIEGIKTTVSAPKVTKVSGIDANAAPVGGLIVVKVMTLDDLSKVELWIEEEVLGLGLDET